MKVKKEAVIRRNQVATKTETHILKQIRHPFSRGCTSRSSRRKLYMVLNYLPGGELFYRLKREGRFSVERVRLYAAEIGLGLGHLHSLDMIYRDLKPENILLDEVGHICLTDFGLSKESVATVNAAKTFCGTPMPARPRSSRASATASPATGGRSARRLRDAHGLPPSTAEHQPHVREDPQGRARCLVLSDVKSLIEGLLIRDPVKRLGSGPGDIKELEANAFFKDLDFKKVEAKEYTPITSRTSATSPTPATSTHGSPPSSPSTRSSTRPPSPARATPRGSPDPNDDSALKQ